MYPGDRLLCFFVQPVERSEFRGWPLHITVVPWFRLALPATKLSADLAAAFAKFRVFDIRVAGEAFFGRRHSRVVDLLEASAEMSTIEQACRQYLHAQNAWIVDETTRRRFAYRPHVTRQGNVRVYGGDVIRCQSVCIVEQHGDYKTVVDKVELGA